MHLIVTLLVGALIGWLASMIMKTNAQQGAILNIIVGVVGAYLGRWIFGDVLHIGGAYTAGSLSLMGILWGVLGAVVLIFLLKAIRILR